MRLERRRWRWGPATCPANLPPDFGLSLVEAAGVEESEEGSKEERVARAATPSTGWPTPRQGHRLKLPHPRLSRAFFPPFRIHAIGHSADVES